MITGWFQAFCLYVSTNDVPIGYGGAGSSIARLVSLASYFIERHMVSLVSYAIGIFMRPINGLVKKSRSQSTSKTIKRSRIILLQRVGMAL